MRATACSGSAAAWRRDAGLRIDHLLLSPVVADRLVGAGVDREGRGLDHTSNHAPAWIQIADCDSRRSWQLDDLLEGFPLEWEGQFEFMRGLGWPQPRGHRNDGFPNKTTAALKTAATRA